MRCELEEFTLQRSRRLNFYHNRTSNISREEITKEAICVMFLSERFINRLQLLLWTLTSL